MLEVKHKFSLSVIIPVFNDEEVLPELCRRLEEVLVQLSDQWEIIFIDDGSYDASLNVLLDLQQGKPNLKIIQLTRNFGQPNAVAAGLDYAQGEVIVLMDSDLQDRPEDISQLLEAMIINQASMAIATCADRNDDPFKIVASRWFNSLANRITNVQYEPKTRVFRVIKRELVDMLKDVHEKTATPLSILAWMGGDYVTVELDREPRYAGKSGYTFWRMLDLSLDRIFSHSLLPIRLSSIFGVFLGLASILLAFYFIIQKLFLQSVLPGWTSIVVIVLFLLGMNFIFIGFLGEYMGRIYMEVKNRPRYVVKDIFQGGVEPE